MSAADLLKSFHEQARALHALGVQAAADVAFEAASSCPTLVAAARAGRALRLAHACAELIADAYALRLVVDAGLVAEQRSNAYLPAREETAPEARERARRDGPQ